MIASITGKITRKSTDYLIVDVSGLGYQVHVPLSTYYHVPDTGHPVTLHIHTHVREDALSLFGFLTPSEKEMFLLLMSVSGIGPKLALAVLSSMTVSDLACAIQTGDDSKLCSIPGIGKKTAGRLVLELKKKVSQLVPQDTPSDGGSSVTQRDLEDALSALVNLGFRKPLAELTLEEIRKRRAGLSVEGLIREALNVLMKK